MLKIRLRRMGSRHRPHYRVVVSDSRRTPTSSAIDEIGFYDPRKNPKLLKIDLERVDYWKGHGAQLSDTVRKLVRHSKRQPEETPVEPAKPEKKGKVAKAAEKAVEVVAETAEKVADVVTETAEAVAETVEAVAEAVTAESTEAEATSDDASADEEKADKA